MAYRSHLLAFAAAVGGLCASPAAAQRLSVEAGKWNVDYGNIRCSLARRFGGPQSPVLILTSYLGRDEPEFILMRDGSEALPPLPQRVDVVLSPGGEVARGVVRTRRVQAGQVASVQELGEGFIDRFAQAQQVRLQSGGRVISDVQIPGAGAAVAALKACNDDLLRSWGIDPDVELTQRPRLVRGEITHSDYPSALVSAGTQGTVVTRFMVGPTGQVTSCSPVVSSGHQELDAVTCALISERYRYNPALDRDGRPTATMLIQTVRWMLPDY